MKINVDGGVSDDRVDMHIAVFQNEVFTRTAASGKEKRSALMSVASVFVLVPFSRREIEFNPRKSTFSFTFTLLFFAFLGSQFDDTSRTCRTKRKQWSRNMYSD